MADDDLTDDLTADDLVDDLPDTSRKARADTAPRVKADALKVLEAIENEPIGSDGYAGLTTDGVRLRTRLKENTARARADGLILSDRVTVTRNTRKTGSDSGSQARLMVVTPRQWQGRVLLEAIENRPKGESDRAALLRVKWVEVGDPGAQVVVGDDPDPRKSDDRWSDDELKDLEAIAGVVTEARGEADAGGTPRKRTTYPKAKTAAGETAWFVSTKVADRLAVIKAARQRLAGLELTPAGKDELKKHKRPKGVFKGNDDQTRRNPDEGES